MFWNSTIESCQKIPLSLLRKKGLLKPNKWVLDYDITFLRNGVKNGNIYIEVCTLKNDEYVRLYYTITDRDTKEKKYIDYKVKLIRKPSNLGKGYRYYFDCPNTKRLCTVLIKPPHEHYFLHRTAFKILYEKQAYSKQYRVLCDVYYFMDSDLEDYRTRTFAKRRKRIYRGKKTKHLEQFEKTQFRREIKSETTTHPFLKKHNLV